MLTFFVLVLHLFFQVKYCSSKDEFLSYPDPSRGSILDKSQPEVPRIDVDYSSMKVKVMGYHEYSISGADEMIVLTDQESLLRKQSFLQMAFNAVDEIIEDLCKHTRPTAGSTTRSTIVDLSYLDVGSSGGAMLLYSLQKNRRNNSRITQVIGIDHDPDYVRLATSVIDLLWTTFNVRNSPFNHHLQSRPRVYHETVGSTTKKCDIVSAFGILNWIYQSTENFRSMSMAVRHLVSLANIALLVEWIEPSDNEIQMFGLLKTGSVSRGSNTTEEYNFINFMGALENECSSIYGRNDDDPSSTRRLYMCIKRNESWLHNSRKTCEGMKNFTKVYKQVDVTLGRMSREIYWLNILQNYKWFPKIIEVDIFSRKLVTTWEGQPVTAHNLPSNYRKQLESIKKALSEANVVHNDVSLKNLLVNERGQLRLTGFDLAYRASDHDVTCNGLCLPHKFYVDQDQHPQSDRTEDTVIPIYYNESDITRDFQVLIKEGPLSQVKCRNDLAVPIYIMHRVDDAIFSVQGESMEYTDDGALIYFWSGASSVIGLENDALDFCYRVFRITLPIGNLHDIQTCAGNLQRKYKNILAENMIDLSDYIPYRVPFSECLDNNTKLLLERTPKSPYTVHSLARSSPIGVNEMLKFLGSTNLTEFCSNNTLYLNHINVSIPFSSSKMMPSSEGEQLDTPLGSDDSPRILCLVYTHQERHDAVYYQARLWGHLCTGFLAFSDKENNTVPTISIPHEGEESYDNMWLKIVSIWNYTRLNYIDEFDWFYIAGDDTYLIPENLRFFLDNDATILKGKADQKGLYIGRRQRFLASAYTLMKQLESEYFREFLENPIEFYNSGGPGYILDSVALQKFVVALDHCFTNVTASSEDVFSAFCLAKFCGIYSMDTRDVHGRERFHHFSPQVLSMDANNMLNYFGPEFMRFWSSSAVDFKVGKYASAPDTVSFHWLTSSEMFETHAAIRMCMKSN